MEERALLDASAIGFIEANLVSDIPGMAATTDPQLINPWGITASGQSPFWVSDNQNGFSTLYNSAGNKQALVVTIPSAPGSMFAHSTPTGTVFNTDPNGADFAVTAMGTTAASKFLFATLDGTISGWNGTGTNAIIAFQSAGSIFTGLAIDTSQAAGNTCFTPPIGARARSMSSTATFSRSTRAPSRTVPFPAVSARSTSRTSTARSS